MWQHDNSGPFLRCLASFYTAKERANAPSCNEWELPAKIGRAHEFWELWANWPTNPVPGSRKYPY